MKNLDFHKVKKIYFVGIGGIGVSALAAWFLAQKKVVRGDDLVTSLQTVQLAGLGAQIDINRFNVSQIEDVDLVVYSSAVPVDNPARQWALSNQVTQLSYFEVLGLLSHSYRTIAVTGTHGKSTTTALIGLILEAANLDPTVIVGTRLSQWQANFRVGHSSWLVVEACEHKEQMNQLKPVAGVVTSIESDHLDYYQNMANLEKAYQRFADSIPEAGFLLINADGHRARQLKHVGKIAYSLQSGVYDNPTYFIDNYQLNPRLGQSFQIKSSHKDINVPINLDFPGLFNVQNALAAAVVAHRLGVDWEIISQVISQFKGTWRRFEFVSNFQGARIYSDYAHHPTAIEATLRACREWFPQNRLVCLYQPHQGNHTNTLYSGFVRSLALADLVILAEVYDVAGREELENNKVTSQDLVADLKKESKTEVLYAADLKKAESLLRDQVRDNDIVLVMGAGDVDLVARNLK